MFNIQDFKNATVAGNQLIMLVDDVNETYSFGFTDSKSKVLHNMRMIENILKTANTEKALANSKNGLTTLFPLGRYIAILQMSKDKSAMSMTFFDYYIDYPSIDKAFKGLYSDNFINHFKNIKYQMEEQPDQWSDRVVLNTFLEPTEE